MNIIKINDDSKAVTVTQIGGKVDLDDLRDFSDGENKLLLEKGFEIKRSNYAIKHHAGANWAVFYHQSRWALAMTVDGFPNTSGTAHETLNDVFDFMDCFRD